MNITSLNSSKNSNEYFLFEFTKKFNDTTNCRRESGFQEVIRKISKIALLIIVPLNILLIPFIVIYHSIIKYKNRSDDISGVNNELFAEKIAFRSKESSQSTHPTSDCSQELKLTTEQPQIPTLKSNGEKPKLGDAPSEISRSSAEPDITDKSPFADDIDSANEIQQVKDELLREIPSVGSFSLEGEKILALGLLYRAMKDEKHPSFMSQEFNFVKKPPSDDEIEKLVAKGWLKDKITYLNEWQKMVNPVINIEKLLKFIGKVEITLSEIDMLEAFRKYGVIQLRPLCSDTLILGCGNTPANTYEASGRIFHGIQNHDHKNTDTMNISMDMNPSVVAFWGHSQNDLLFTNKQYSLIVDEGPIASFLQNQGHGGRFFAAVRNALKVRGYLALATHVVKNIHEETKLVTVPADFVEVNCQGKAATDYVKASLQSVHGITLFQYIPVPAE